MRRRHILGAILVAAITLNCMGCTKHLDVAEAEKVEDLSVFSQISTEEEVDEIESKQIIPKTVTIQTDKVIKAPKKTEVIFKLTFYTDLNSENGFGPINCLGEQLQPHMIASNYYPLGTKIELEGYGVKEVRDRGGKNFNSSTRLDVYVPRNPGESNRDYYNRIQKMGVQKVKGYILE